MGLSATSLIRRLPMPQRMSTVEQVDEFGLDAVIAARLQQHWRELFFTKDLDWASEHEYRWVVLTEEPLPVFVDVAEFVRVIVLGASVPPSRTASVRQAIRPMGDVEIVAIKYMTGRPQLLPWPESSGAAERPHRRSGGLAMRTQAILDAENDAVAARAEGQRRSAPALHPLVGALDRIAERLREDDTVVQVYDSGHEAVPLEDRLRAAGVAGAEVEYSGGRMCVVEHQPQYSVTLVVAVAAQALIGERLRVHAAIRTERRTDTGTERQQLWHDRRKVNLREGAAAAAQLARDLEGHVDEALSAFENRAPWGPSPPPQ
jgi:hypothetical protein